tara:strand:- start:192 stop:1643 length:1452 start_codon:yes stop_codon:yes gene_type:complete
MVHTKRGFTLIELIVIIGVIGVLAAVAAWGLGRYQEGARDAERAADVAAITEALELYYDENGEYPSCSALTGSAPSVAGQLNVEEGALRSPQSSTQNAVLCSALAEGSEDGYAYVGDGSETCQSGNACLEWTLQYRSEETGEIVSVKSRRSASLASSGDVNLTATVSSNTAINLTWSAVSNASSYTVERSLSSSMSGAVTNSTTATSQSVSGLTAGTRYYFRVTPVSGTQQGVPDTDDATTTISAPSGTLAISSSLQSSNSIARGQAGAVTCEPGTTLEYSFGYQGRNTNSSVSLSYGSWGTAALRDVTASQGYNYTFEARARCVGPDATSSQVTSARTNVTRPINTPPMPNFNGDTSMQAGYRYTFSTSSFCPSGTWVDGAVYIYNSGYTSPSTAHVYPSNGAYYTNSFNEWWYLGWAANQTWEDTYYNSFYRCKTDFTTSPNSPTRQTYVTIDCEPHRRTYNTYPRCDSHGQDPNSLPWGY